MILPDSASRQCIATVNEWVDKAVIGLNLCPFAKSVQVKRQVRYVVSDAADVQTLVSDLTVELKRLVSVGQNEVDTTLFIHPHILHDFLDYNDFLSVADAILDELDLTGIIQIASFHPQYHFADTGPDDIENYTNRSPFPILHLLRESSIEQAVASFPDTFRIYERNIARLRKLGHDGWHLLGLN